MPFMAWLLALSLDPAVIGSQVDEDPAVGRAVVVDALRPFAVGDEVLDRPGGESG
jgi:hypothetical protein